MLPMLPLFCHCYWNNANIQPGCIAVVDEFQKGFIQQHSIQNLHLNAEQIDNSQTNQVYIQHGHSTWVNNFRKHLAKGHYFVTLYIYFAYIPVLYLDTLNKTQADFAQCHHVTLDPFPCSCHTMDVFIVDGSFDCSSLAVFAFITEQVLRYVGWEWL